MTEPRLATVHADCVRRVLLARLPRGARAGVFGSRASGRGSPLRDIEEIEQ